MCKSSWILENKKDEPAALQFPGCYHELHGFDGFLDFLISSLEKNCFYSKLFVCSVNFNRTLLIINIICHIHTSLKLKVNSILKLYNLHFITSFKQ